MVLVVSVSFAEEAQASGNNQYKHMTGEAKFSEIQKQVAHSALSISNYKASDAYQEITSTLADFRKLHTSVRKAHHLDRVIDEVAEKLDRIATAYDRVVDFGGNMKQYRKGEFSYLRNINGKTFKTQQELKNRITSLESENKSFQR